MAQAIVSLALPTAPAQLLIMLALEDQKEREVHAQNKAEKKNKAEKNADKKEKKAEKKAKKKAEKKRMKKEMKAEKKRLKKEKKTESKAACINHAGLSLVGNEQVAPPSKTRQEAEDILTSLAGNEMTQGGAEAMTQADTSCDSRSSTMGDQEDSQPAWSASEAPDDSTAAAETALDEHAVPNISMPAEPALDEHAVPNIAVAASASTQAEEMPIAAGSPTSSAPQVPAPAVVQGVVARPPGPVGYHVPEELKTLVAAAATPH